MDLSIHIRNMYVYSIRGNILEWFESYLAGRPQYVTYDGINLDIYFLEWSSILGPLLFIIFTNDMF